jgi:hypothetical protein
LKRPSLTKKRRTTIRIVIAVLLSVLLWPLATSPERHIQKQVEQAASVQVTTAADTPAAPQEALATESKRIAQPQPENAAKTPEPKPQVAETSQPLSDKEQLMTAAGIPREDWAATDYIVAKESSWNPTAKNPTSGAYGLCQSYPASKMASAGQDYMINPVTQLKWCHDYAHNRYGGWWSSFAFWKANRWW